MTSVEVGGSNDCSEIELVSFCGDWGSESIDVVTGVVACNDNKGVNVRCNIGEERRKQGCSGMFSTQGHIGSSWNKTKHEDRVW